METKRDNIARIPTRNFIVPRNFCSNIQRSISNLPNGSAAGQDMMYYEMFKVSADTLAQFLMALWTTCGRLNRRPLEWNKDRLVPLYKRGDPAIPSNHRPICLLSSTRKIIERAIASAMNECFAPHRAQMGFQKHIGTEMALVQINRASNQRQNCWIAILDRKSAYDRVCRATLMKRCDEALPEGLANMVSHIIREFEVHIVGDETGTNAKINRVVTQGGPASPTLFNIYIATLASQLCASVNNIQRTPVCLYADTSQWSGKVRQKMHSWFSGSSDG